MAGIGVGTGVSVGGTVTVGNDVGDGCEEVGVTIVVAVPGRVVGRGVLVGRGVSVAVGGAAVGCWNKGVGELTVTIAVPAKGVRVGNATTTSSVGRTSIVPPSDTISFSPVIIP